MTQPTPDDLFNEIEAFIAKSHEFLKEGKVMNASELEDQVKRLCESVLSLSPEERVEHTDRMDKLLVDLTTLSQQMNAHRDQMAEQLGGLEQNKKAHHAYKKADAIDQYGQNNKDEND